MTSTRSTWPEYPASDARSVGVAVLELLAEAHVQLVLPDDIPEMLAFVSTPEGRTQTAWARFDAYWEGLDWAEREKRCGALPTRR